MSPKPDDDLFIEPASDDDVIYGDYNSTMDGASSSGQRPYIRLTSQLRNATRDAGGEVRFRCEAIGTPPLSFTWLKNHAPLEKGRRVRVRHKESSSRLVISELDVLDSGYYQCIASNAAASVNTTSVLRVNNVSDAALKNRKSKTSHIANDYEDYELMDRGRLPDEEEAELFRVPDSAGGRGFAPEGVNERWLDGIKYRVGDCLPYRGEACRSFLAGRHVMMTSESREDMYDIDRNLRAAMMFINSSPSISQKCRQISQSVACYHMYKVCDGTSGSKQPLAICKKDCDRITSEVCPSELSLAAQHELVGDGPKALFPSCPSLPAVTNNCIPVLETPPMPSPETPRGQLVHWCYVNTGTKYEGSIATTTSGKACIDWQHSTSREFNVHRYPALENSRNFCRNPGGKKTKPWCYAQPMGQEEYCDVPQCPKEMYPHLQESNDHATDSSFSLTSLWEGMSSQWQLLSVGGGVALMLLLLLLLCCLCCCRRSSRKKTKSKGRPAPRPAHNHMSGPPSIINSAANSAYYRKMQAAAGSTSTPILPRGAGGNPMEMMSLLPSEQHRNPPMYQEEEHRPAYMEPYHIPQIQHDQLQICDLIGEGQFGLVHTGMWSGGLISGEPLQVAIKTCRPDATNAHKATLEEEVRTVAAFDHPHVVRLLGVCYLDGGRLAAVFEYMVHGDLLDFLHLRAPHDQPVEDQRKTDHDDFMNIAIQISLGMEYLSSMSYVHRDLAARNCLVGDGRVIKVADFGLMRACYDGDYYKMVHRAWMPVRWMSKEALEQGKFSEWSDVWAFGVTLWEIWSYGRHPYEAATNQEVIDFITNRHLLDCPTGCPSNIYSLMVECWHEHMDRRPSFAEIHQRLSGWAMASPAPSMMLMKKGAGGAGGSSSQSGSSLSTRPAPYSSRAIGRRTDDVPLVRRDANYAYSDDGDSD